MLRDHNVVRDKALRVTDNEILAIDYLENFETLNYFWGKTSECKFKKNILFISNELFAFTKVFFSFGGSSITSQLMFSILIAEKKNLSLKKKSSELKFEWKFEEMKRKWKNIKVDKWGVLILQWKMCKFNGSETSYDNIDHSDVWLSSSSALPRTLFSHLYFL